MAIDNRTPALDLPLPHQDNTLEEDVLRLRGALTAIDTAVSGKQAALGFTPENAANKGVANGYADLDSSGKVPAVRLPSFVDDVLEFANLAAFPETGETGKIYVTLGGADAGKTYRWSGSAYVEISPSPGSTDDVPEGAANKYFTDARARAAQQPATAGALGVVKVGAGLNVGVDGTLAVTGSGGGGTGLPAFDEVFIVPTVDGTTNLVPDGGYIPGQIELLFNGAELYGNGDDYTASDGVNIALNITANTTDKFLLRRWKYLPEGNALNKVGDNMTGPLGLVGNAASALHAVPKQQLDSAVDALKDVQANAQAGTYTLTLADRGKSVDAQGNITVPANGSVVFPVGAVVTITNVTAASITIAITTDTLRLAGTTTTGTRTLSGWGVATMRKIASTVWVISGAGLT